MRDPFTRDIPYWGSCPAVTMNVPFFGIRIPVVIRPTTAAEELQIAEEADGAGTSPRIQDAQEIVSRLARSLCQIREDVVGFDADPAKDMEMRLEWVRNTVAEVNDESLTAYTLARVRLRLEKPPVDEEGDVQRLPMPDGATEALLSEISSPLLGMLINNLPAWHRAMEEPPPQPPPAPEAVPDAPADQ